MARKGGQDRGIFVWPSPGPDGKPIYGIRYVDDTGRERKEKAGASKSRARQLYAQRKTEVHQGRFRPEDARARRLRTSLADALQAYVDSLRGRRKSWAQMDYWRRVFSAAWPGRALQSITAADVERWVGERLAEGYAPATANRARAFLHRFFQVQIRDRRTDRNPVAQVERAVENNARVRCLSEAELDRLRAASPPGLWLMMVIAIQTCLRAAEQFSLRWTDVDLAGRVITVPHPKGDRAARHVPISDEALEALQQLPSRMRSEWVFPSRRHGQHVSRWGPRKAFEAALAAAAVADFTWHDLRHTGASRLTKAGVRERHVQEILGHSSAAMTRRYSHLDREDLLAAVNRAPRVGIGSQSENSPGSGSLNSGNGAVL